MDIRDHSISALFKEPQVQGKKHGPAPSCICGNCIVCRQRINKRRFYQRHREEIIPRNVQYKKNRKEVSLVTDEEMDQKVMMWLEQLQG